MPADLAAKVQAIAAYASQISTFWEDVTAMEAAIHDFAARVGEGGTLETPAPPAQGAQTAEAVAGEIKP